MRCLRRDATGAAHADQGGGTVLRGLLPTLFDGGTADRNTHEAIEAKKQVKPKTLRFSQLSPARQALVRACQAVNFGEIQGVVVRDTEPVFGEPVPVLIIDAKLDQEDEPRAELELADFELREEVCRLTARLDYMKNGSILRIEVRAGVPRRVVFETTFGDSTAATLSR